MKKAIQISTYCLMNFMTVAQCSTNTYFGSRQAIDNNQNTTFPLLNFKPNSNLFLCLQAVICNFIANEVDFIGLYHKTFCYNDTYNTHQSCNLTITEHLSTLTLTSTSKLRLNTMYSPKTHLKVKDRWRVV